MDKRARVIEELKKIIKDLEAGFDGFLYLYDVLFPWEKDKKQEYEDMI